MCHPLTPREATQAPVAKTALAKVSSTTADVYPSLSPKFSAASSHEVRCSWGSMISFRTLWCSPHKRLSRGGAKKLPEVFFSSNPSRFKVYNDRHYSCLSQVPPPNTETGSGNSLGAIIPNIYVSTIHRNFPTSFENIKRSQIK